VSKSCLLASIAFFAACGPTAVTSDGGGSGSGSGGDDAPSCASATVSAQQSPLDLYLMLDQSGSMSDMVSGGGDKWGAVTGALTSFLAQSGLTGISIGLQYFGLDDGSGFNDSCTASTYATAAVEIAALPGVAGQINSSIAMHGPSTGTPTSAALQGAVNHASSWATAHPGHVAAAILATDGDPEECDTTLSDIDAIAAAGYAATPKIATFVIGVGSSLSNLNGIAAAGGTTQAFLVDTGGNVNMQFLAAMNAIRNSASCQYTIPVPASGTPNFAEVNVVFTPDGGSATTIPNVASASACPSNGNGWYYDNANAPTAIVLCGSTCGSVLAGTVNIQLGCSTVIL
jgi:hypothetical protein